MTYKVGERLGGRYEVYYIAGGAGRSGMGTVYICYDHNNGSARVAELVTHFPRRVQRVDIDHREARPQNSLEPSSPS